MAALAAFRAWSKGKYRWRTQLRVVLPARLGRRMPRGSHDCGNHEWYGQDGKSDLCHHCVATRQASTLKRFRFISET